MMTAGIRLRSVIEERHDDPLKYPTMASDEALLMPASVMERMAEAIDGSLGKEAEKFWYDLGEEMGKSMATNVIAKTKSKRSRVFKLLIEEIQLMGWGKITIYNKKFGGIEGTFRVEAATLLRNNQSGSRCQLLRGFLTGSLATTYNADDITCVEISCTGKGDSYCGFKVERPRKSWLRSVFY